MHQWATIDNADVWACQCQVIQYCDLTAEMFPLTETKIGPTAAILNLTKKLLDLHQGPIIGHNCALYE